MPTSHKELSYVEDIGIIGRWRTSRDQRESDNLNATPNEKWEAALGLRPVQRQFLVSKTAVGAQLKSENCTQIVGVQLQEIGQ